MVHHRDCQLILAIIYDIIWVAIIPWQLPGIFDALLNLPFYLAVGDTLFETCRIAPPIGGLLIVYGYLILVCG